MKILKNLGLSVTLGAGLLAVAPQLARAADSAARPRLCTHTGARACGRGRRSAGTGFRVDCKHSRWPRHRAERATSFRTLPRCWCAAPAAVARRPPAAHSRLARSAMGALGLEILPRGPARAFSSWEDLRPRPRARSIGGGFSVARRCVDWIFLGVVGDAFLVR